MSLPPPDLPSMPLAAARWLAAPFDAMRHQYAAAVTSGWVPRSLLASGRLERALEGLERCALGPLARAR